MIIEKKEYRNELGLTHYEEKNIYRYDDPIKDQSKIVFQETSNDEMVFYLMAIQNKFRKNQTENIEVQIIKNALQTMVDQTHKTLRKYDVNDVVPIVFLLQTQYSKKIEKISKKMNIASQDLIKYLLQNAFELNFDSNLKETIQNKLISTDLKLSQVKKLFDKEELNELKESLK